jgi:cellulose biosynthesis protein BcsQ
MRFNCSGFTKCEKLTQFVEKNKVSILLTDDICFKKNARNINSEITVILTEKPEFETTPNVYEINILQPVDEIVRELLKTVAKTDIPVAQNPLLPNGKIYSFFSPVGRSLKTTLAIAASQILSDKEKTIYINLEPDSGFSVLFGQNFDTDLSDLIFYLRDDEGKKSSLMIQSSICNSQGVSFIPPVVNPEDLFQISCDEIINLFILLQKTGFRNIIVDMGTLIPGFEKILSTSEMIYMPVRKDSISSAKIIQLFAYLRTLEDAQIEDKIQRLEPPFFQEVPSIAYNLRGTEISKYMAGILYG